MTGDLPVVDPATLQDAATDASVHGTVLAAGTSSRYGEENKLLERVDGDPLVCHAARSLLDADLAGVTVVLGYERDRVAAALAAFDVDYRDNQAYADGQSTSVHAAVTAARDRDADAVVFALGDMPAVESGTVQTLVEAYRRGAGTALSAGYEGQRGNPVLFDACHFDALAAVSGDVGGREVLLSAPDAAIVETGDPGVLRDVDRPGDL
jgi:molybdenum cofactor cytidylyltransferase